MDNIADTAHGLIESVSIEHGAGGEDVISSETGMGFVPKTPEAFTYDADGNLLTDGRWEYTWNAENRLVAMETRSDIANNVLRKRIQFKYDCMGRRILKEVYHWVIDQWDLAEVRWFVYDGWNLVRESMTFHTGTPYNDENTYVWGLDLSGSLQGAGGVGGLLSVSLGHAPQPSSVLYPVFDGNGNVTALVDARTWSSEPAVIYEYDPYGNTTRESGELAERNAFGFSTKYEDWESDLLYYGYRFYNPELGRWLNRDPLGESGGRAIYAFCMNSPVLWYDNRGLYVVEEVLKNMTGKYKNPTLDDLIREVDDKIDTYLGNPLGKVGLYSALVVSAPLNNGISRRLLRNYLRLFGGQDPMLLSSSDVRALDIAMDLHIHPPFMADVDAHAQPNHGTWFKGRYSVYAQANLENTLGQFHADVIASVRCVARNKELNWFALGVLQVEDDYDFDYQRSEAERAFNDLLAGTPDTVHGYEPGTAGFGRTAVGELETVAMSRLAVRQQGWGFAVRSVFVPFEQDWKKDRALIK